MSKSDKKLGMDRPITRRDFVNGVLVSTAGAALLGPLSACSEVNVKAPAIYPPGKLGLRGNHDSSFEVAHALGREGQTDFGPVRDIEDRFDLVIVGAGISGLAAAHFHRKENPNARILLLDNHDDFGGHATRNEFSINGRTLLMNGGSEYVTSPYTYSDIVNELFDDMGIDLTRLKNGFDEGFKKRHGLTGVFHFSEDLWPKKTTVKTASVADFWNLELPEMSMEESIDQFPISDKAKDQLKHVVTETNDVLPGMSQDEKYYYLTKISYREFLTKHLSVTEQEVFDIFQDQTGDLGLGIDTLDASSAMTYCRLPGFAATGRDPLTKPDLTGYHQFPDGNATIVRLLVRSMIPGVAPGNTMEDVIMARFDYGMLDQDGVNVRVRLNSTVTNVANVEGGVNVTYIKDGSANRVTADKCILACNNAVIPFICPEIPGEQKSALSNQVRQPILANRAVIKNWHAFKELGIGGAALLGGYHTFLALQNPVSLGDFVCPSEPDEPIIVSMFKYPHVNNAEMSAQDQYRAGRYELLDTPYEDIERHMRSQLDDLFGDHGFNAAEDIEAIIVNRWAHGYSYSTWSHTLFEDDYDDQDDPRYLHVQARKPLGRITIANSDAGGMAMLESAIEQAHRAVRELQDS